MVQPIAVSEPEKNQFLLILFKRQKYYQIVSPLVYIPKHMLQTYDKILIVKYILLII